MRLPGIVISRKRAAVTALALCLLERGAPAGAQLVVRETSLGVRGIEQVHHIYRVSNAMRLAYLVSKPEGDAVVIDGVREPVYGHVQHDRTTRGMTFNLSFSRDGVRYIYVVEQDGGMRAVVDGVPGPLYDSIEPVGELYGSAFSPDSRHVAYRATRAGRSMMIVDGVPRAPEAFDGWPFTTPDGKHRIYRIRRDGDELLVFDGKEVARADSIVAHFYDDSSGRIAVVMKKGSGWVVSVDGKEGETYRRIEMMLRFSQDGRRVAYIARDSLTHVVVDGVPSRGYAQVAPLSVGFSADGAHVAYLVAEHGKMFWVLDGQEQKRYDRIVHSYGTPFRSDGLPLVYVVTTQNGYFVVSGTREGQLFDGIQEFYGSREWIVYSARRGDRKFIVVNDSLYESARITQVWGSTRTTELSVQRANGWHLAMDGAEFGPYDEEVRNVFVGGDGRRGFVAVRGGKQFAVIDGSKGLRLTGLCPPCSRATAATCGIRLGGATSGSLLQTASRVPTTTTSWKSVR